LNSKFRFTRKHLRGHYVHTFTIVVAFEAYQKIDGVVTGRFPLHGAIPPTLQFHFVRLISTSNGRFGGGKMRPSTWYSAAFVSSNIAAIVFHLRTATNF
jgi:hypothetical protein